MVMKCCICGAKKDATKRITLHKLPSKLEVRLEWLKALELKEEDINDYTRVCSQHFRDGDITKVPSLSVGIKFGSKPGRKRIKSSFLALTGKSSPWNFSHSFRVTTVFTSNGSDSTGQLTIDG